jgi:uncharacterized protein (DUF1697 family)
MAAFVALLRAVNLGGSTTLAMADLKAICESAGLAHVRTFIASGNVVFVGAGPERQVRAALEAGLKTHTGRAIGVSVRSSAEMAAIVADNPFPDAPGNRVAVIFLDEAATPAMLDGVSGRAADEELSLGRREIYVRYGAAGMGRSKLKIPAAKAGTARNMNTVARLAAMAAA